MKFILVAGMPGAGKSIFVEIARERYNLPVYTMGDVVREEALRRYGVVSPDTMLKTALELRREFGLDYVAAKTFEKIYRVCQAGCEAVVIDGVRSIDEVEYFKRRGDVVIVAIHASPKTRFNRLLARGRPGDPKTWEEFATRDKIELELGLGSVIALADYMIINEGGIEEARNNVCKVLGEILGVRRC